MSFVSYAQNLEDVMLFRALKNIQHGFYVDIGAQDPVIDSVTKAFYDRGWQGINIEPVTEYFQLLQQDRIHDINLNSAVSSFQGDIVFYEIPHTGMSTANKIYADQCASKGWEIREYKVPCTTLDNICEMYEVNTIHFLKIDVEGSERAVLQGFTLQKVRPWIIVIEANEPNSTLDISQEWEHSLLNKGYEFVYYDGLNRFYIAHEHSELQEHFRLPPNYFDQYILYPQYLAQQQLREEHSQRETLVKQLADESAQRKELSAQLKQECNQREVLIIQLKDEYAQKEALANKLTDVLGEKEILANKLTDVLAEKEALRVSLSVEQNQREILSAQLQQLCHSLSWRLTAPLRKGRNVLAALMTHPAALAKRAVRKILRFMLRYEWVLRLGRQVLRGHPGVRQRLAGLAGLTTPYVLKTPPVVINNASSITVHLSEPARTIYDRLRDCYHGNKIYKT